MRTRTISFLIGIMLFVVATVVFVKCNTSDTEVEASTGYTTQVYSLNNVRTAITPNHYYNLLSNSEQQVYTKLLETLGAFEETCTIEDTESATVEKVYQFMLNDHPEIFYCDGYSYATYVTRDTVSKVVITPNYTGDPISIRKRQVEIRTRVTNCLSELPASASDYEVTKFVYNWVIDNVEYVDGSIDSQNICSTLLNGESVCQGYAKTVQLLLNQAGVYCTLVTGKSESGESHAWNLVYLDDGWYYIDATNGDASYIVEETTNLITKVTCYEFLNIPTGKTNYSYVPDYIDAVPMSYDVEDNYYVKEGCFFSTLNVKQLENLLTSASVLESGFVVIKCSSSDVCSDITTYLIDERNVLKWLKVTNIAYTNSEKYNTLTLQWDT